MRSFQIAVMIVGLGGIAGSAVAELQPQEVAILASKSSRESLALATYYAQQRGIPERHICQIELPAGEVLDRDLWDSARREIRTWIAQNKLQNQLRCFVTTYGVPLKIGRVKQPDTNSRRRQRLLEMERERRVKRLADFAVEFDAIAPVEGAPSAGNFPATGKLEEMTSFLATRLKAAENRIQALTPGPTQQQSIRRLTQLSVATAGLQVVIQNMQKQLEAGGGNNERLLSEFHYGRGRLGGLTEGQQLLEGLHPSPERDTNLVALLERNAGIAGSVRWIDLQLDALEKNESYASFDSELSLVMENPYPLLRWLPNYLHYNYDGAPIRGLSRTLMVGRIDGPTPQIAKRLIDEAIATEKKGLQGTVYLDAAGNAKLDGSVPAAGTKAEYDRSLLLASKLFEDHTSLEVVVDDSPELFKEGACPDAALYCGWYSLSKYVDSFQWVPGAVGYHMASGEAATLRQPDSQVWCKRMLEEGVVATIGPVYEPYLLAFPRPHEFFALLLSGKFTYAECIYRTQATNSWVMTAVGDPLYNPFRARPALTTIPPEYQRVFGTTQN